MEEKLLEIKGIVEASKESSHSGLLTGAGRTETQTETQSVCKVSLCAEVKAAKTETRFALQITAKVD